MNKHLHPAMDRDLVRCVADRLSRGQSARLIAQALSSQGLTMAMARRAARHHKAIVADLKLAFRAQDQSLLDADLLRALFVDEPISFWIEKIAFSAQVLAERDISLREAIARGNKDAIAEREKAKVSKSPGATKAQIEMIKYAIMGMGRLPEERKHERKNGT